MMICVCSHLYTCHTSSYTYTYAHSCLENRLATCPRATNYPRNCPVCPTTCNAGTCYCGKCSCPSGKSLSHTQALYTLSHLSCPLFHFSFSHCTLTDTLFLLFSRNFREQLRVYHGLYRTNHLHHGGAQESGRVRCVRRRRNILHR